MQQPLDEQYQNYLSQLHATLEVLSAGAQEQCELTGAYNAPWELRQDGVDFIESVLALANGKLEEPTTIKLLALGETLAALPADAISPEGQDTTTAEGCLFALNHPAWTPVRSAAASCLLLVKDPFG